MKSSTYWFSSSSGPQTYYLPNFKVIAKKDIKHPRASPEQTVIPLTRVSVPGHYLVFI